MRVWHVKIRNIAVCLIRNNNKIFVFEGFDEVNNEVFYRPLGGGIEFGELAESAAAREFMEEVGAEIKNIQYVATFENIFSFNGKPSHEIVILLKAEFVNESMYSKNEVECVELDTSFIAKWIPIEEFINGSKVVYPDGILEYL